MKNMMWAYLLHLGDNMWRDEWDENSISPFYEELSMDEQVWRKIIDFLPSQGIDTVLIDLGDGMEYERHPELAVKGAWSKDKLKKELDYIRSLGMTPLPKLNFSACHDAWLKEYSRMLSTTPYYQVCKDVIEEVVEVFDNPQYFHLGLDEENAELQRCLQHVCIRQKDLWWHDAYYLFNVCENLGVRPWVWADACWKNPEEYVEKMPKSVLQSNWWYNTIKEKNSDGIYPRAEYDTYRVLEEAGFDQIPTSSSFEGYQFSSDRTMKLGKNVIHPERLKGYMTVPWRNTRTRELYALFNDAYQFGIAKKDVYPETCK